MNRKQRIGEILSRYITGKAELRSKMQAVQLDDNSSPERREQLMQQHTEELAKLGANAYLDVKAIVEQAKTEGGRNKALPSTKAAGGAEYQLQLSNALEMLKIAAKQMDVDDIQNALKPFEADSLAMAAFRGVLAASGMAPMEVERALQPFKASQTLEERLIAFLKSVEVIHHESPVYGMELGVASALYMLSHWNDDMTDWDSQ